jgi:hypothetical protein
LGNPFTVGSFGNPLFAGFQNPLLNPMVAGYGPLQHGGQFGHHQHSPFSQFGQFGSPLGQIGPQFGQFGPQLGQFGPQLGQFGPQLGQFGPQLGQLGPLGQIGSQLGQFGSQQGQLSPYSQIGYPLAPQSWVGQGGPFGGAQGFGQIHPLLQQIAMRPYQGAGIGSWGQ